MEHLDSLNKVIQVQDQLIKFLQAEVERLKASQVTINPLPPSPQPVFPSQPSYPGYPYQPNPTPWWQPVIIGSGSTSGTTIHIGDLPQDPGTQSGSGSVNSKPLEGIVIGDLPGSTGTGSASSSTNVVFTTNESLPYGSLQFNGTTLSQGTSSNCYSN